MRKSISLFFISLKSVQKLWPPVDKGVIMINIVLWTLWTVYNILTMITWSEHLVSVATGWLCPFKEITFPFFYLIQIDWLLTFITKFLFYKETTIIIKTETESKYFSGHFSLENKITGNIKNQSKQTNNKTCNINKSGKSMCLFYWKIYREVFICFLFTFRNRGMTEKY